VDNTFPIDLIRIRPAPASTGIEGATSEAVTCLPTCQKCQAPGCHQPQLLPTLNILRHAVHISHTIHRGFNISGINKQELPERHFQETLAHFTHTSKPFGSRTGICEGMPSCGISWTLSISSRIPAGVARGWLWTCVSNLPVQADNHMLSFTVAASKVEKVTDRVRLLVFDFTLWDLEQAVFDGCSFCKWILEANDKKRGRDTLVRKLGILNDSVTRYDPFDKLQISSDKSTPSSNINTSLVLTRLRLQQLR
jgi:hypothetical protein